MANNAELGLTLQKIICDEYKITPCDFAGNQFAVAFNVQYLVKGTRIVRQIFDEIGANPKECLTFRSSDHEKELRSPHNFLLEDGKTFSIRTNHSGDKVAPRVVGQCGIQTFNEYFSDIAGGEIEEKNEIKKVIIDQIHRMLPTFIDYLFLSDYTAWIQEDAAGELRYTLFDKSNYVDVSPERENFSFTRDLETWTESTTLKYLGKPLAEIQIHTNRTFKFRFIMHRVVELLVAEKTTTETMGITAEKVICDISGLVTPSEYRHRYSVPLSNVIRPTLQEAFKYLPKAIKCTGPEAGVRGKNSKCSYDFLLEGGKTLSVKTNTGKMVCPPEVGQPGSATCRLYFDEFLDEGEVTDESFKTMVFAHIAEIIPIYARHLFDSDYLLWLYKTGQVYNIGIFNYGFADQMKWEAEKFSFTKNSLEEWNESNTVKYDGVSIGEFQVHKHRSCFKFRFNLENLQRMVLLSNTQETR